MKTRTAAALLIILSVSLRLGAQSPTGYTEQTAMALLETIEGTPFVHTESPEAQWYPKAGLGLFIHWGIHSVAGGDPSWSMLKNVPWLTGDVHVEHDKYYRLADEFDPSDYDPEEWARTAKETGFTYMVITVKHHDGYCLWPSKYGEYNTGTRMHGRDLVGPLVAACRKYGLKIGLYFSPRDWSYPDYPVQYIDWDYANRRRGSQYPPEENQRKYDEFFRYTCGQMSEILTRYGKIDVLWFDGIGWPGVNTHHDVLHSWLRALQPGMVVNPRWEVQGYDVNFGQTTEFGAKAPFGDFRTEEVAWRKRMEEGRPYPHGEWWEYNEPWSGHWGYSPGARFRDFDSVIAALVYARSYGGNYLPDIGPQPDGGMRPAFYRECAKLKAWMDVNAESVIGTDDYPDWEQISNHPLTIAPKDSGDVTYAHFLKGKDGHLEMKADKKPLRVVLLADGTPVSFTYKKKVLTLDVPEGKRGGPCEVVKIVFSGKPSAGTASTSNNRNDSEEIFRYTPSRDDPRIRREGDRIITDRNGDGIWGGPNDMVFDFIPADSDGNPAMLFMVENSFIEGNGRNRGHYMAVIDTDNDGVFAGIDWQRLQLRNWKHDGLSDFYTDYLGQSAFLKIHEDPAHINDLSLNWEVPFLFYDKDRDGLSEIAVRMLDQYTYDDDRVAQLKGRVDWVSMSFDMDNDNRPGNECDYDMTLHFGGEGFGYRDMVHTNSNLAAHPDLPDTLRYPDHSQAHDAIFGQGKWDYCWFTYDEDDDCNRWERVELYQPRDPFIIGEGKGGVDNNYQSDPSGDRGEWDKDFSGEGKLYISPFDGKIHLYGAESGIWRIDQGARWYQGMGGSYEDYGPKRMHEEPEAFATVRYTDTDGNGFFDLFEYDLDGDGVFESSDVVKADAGEIFDTSSMTYSDFTALQQRVADLQWSRAQEYLALARDKGVETFWYSRLMHPKSVRERYDHGFWLWFYLSRDMQYGNK